ncbi:glutathione S-transferase family protein [Jiella sp. MQZ9-1]|uniref:Glutathione S-transferase family protein n=1 Tax=Jiella flava TaxID=2816857 RepID=A0A939JTC5_9HYPH|nr:glutathione S-transferase family protein [Jiella flava]MBO0663843.1 glutathione S-transferase family protein [Jiella flava]MCD2472416.1 glutathione S-transferase family protein [Jiella flava]
MLTVHNLAFSRAMRVAWLLEELAVPYKVKTYARTDAYRAPAALKAIHPLGKSPVIQDGDLTLGESAAILRYIDRHYGDGRFSPAAGSHDAAHHDEWLDYAEGTLARPIAAGFWARKNGTKPDTRTREELATHFGYLTDTLSARPFLLGGQLTLADIQLSYLLAMAERSDLLGDWPVIQAYWQHLKAVPALTRAIGKTGPIMPDPL